MAKETSGPNHDAQQHIAARSKKIFLLGVFIWSKKKIIVRKCMDGSQQAAATHCAKAAAAAKYKLSFFFATSLGSNVCNWIYYA